MSFRIDQLAVYNLATVGGSITAGSFVKSGGTSSQFLKADGSVDSSAYITGITSGMVTTALGYTPVPNSRNLTINGTTYDLTADRSWTISIPVSSVSGSGAGISVSPTTGAVVVSNTGVTSNVAGTGISVSGATGAVTITNTGVTSIVAGTAITISGATGAVTINNAGVTSVNGNTGAITGIITTSNYNSYSPTLTGGGASGTWSINISGTAGSETLATVTGRGASTTTNIETTSGSSYIRVSGIVYGSYLEISGNLPGYSNGQYPVIKSGGTIHFANNGKYSAYLEANDTYFGIMNSSQSTKVLLHTNGTSYFTGGVVGIGLNNPSTGDRVEIAGTLRVHTGNNWDAIQIYTDGANGYIQGLGDETGLRIRSEYGNILLADNRANVLVGTTTDYGHRVSISGTGYATSDFRAPIFYDSDNTAYYGNFAGTSNFNVVLAKGYADPNYTRIYAPGGGYSVNNSPQSGSIKIKLPTAASYTNTMLSFTVQIYNYSTYTSRTIRVGGYTYYTTDWYNIFAYQIGDQGADDLNVRFGKDGTGACIWIGETSTSWSYPNIFVTDVQSGHSQPTSMVDGWSVSIVTSFDTVQSTITAYKNINTGNYNSYSPTLTGGGASGTWGINITGNAATASTSSQVTINYNNDSNSTYQMLWGSGNSVYGTAGVYVNPYTDTVYANKFSSYYDIEVYTASGADYLRITDNQVYRPNGGGLYLNWSSGGNVYITGTGSGNGRAGVGTNSPAYKMHVVGDIYADGGWLRVSGTAGLYFESYGGGWRMTDSSYIRTYNNKALSMEGASVDYVGSIYMNGGVYISTDNTRNLRLKGTASSDMGIVGIGSGNQFAFQVYGDGGGNYGFLDSTWGSWNLRKNISNGNLYMNNDSTYYLNTNGSTKLYQVTNAGALGTNASNARNHFTQYNTGTTSPAGGWIAAAFGDNTNNRVVIGQWNGNTGAIIGGHTANLDDWSGLSYVAKTHYFYANADYTGTVSMLLDASHHLTVRGYVFTPYINTSDNDEPSATRFIIKNGDNYHRSITVANAASVLSGSLSGYYLPYGNWAGNTGMNDYRLYLRTSGDTNHYLWNAADDWEELGAYAGTGFRVTSNNGANGLLYVYGSSNGGYTYSPYSFRAPIFYDSDDTGYYGNFASFSYLNQLGIADWQYIGGQTSNGQSNYQWEGATYRNPGDWTARLIVRRDNASTGINGAIPSLVLFNNNGSDQTTVSMVFATNECSSGSNSVNLAGIIAKKEAAGTCGGWSPGSLTFFVKDYGTRRDALYLDTSGYVSTPYSFRAPIFYDSDNTGYYCDPAGGSRLNVIYCGDVYNDLGGWFRNYGATGIYNQSYGQHFYSDSSAWWNMGGNSGGQGIRFRDTHGGTVRGHLYYDTSYQVGFLDNAGNWSLRVDGSQNVFVHGYDLTVGYGRTSSNIYMYDSDENTRRIHCNSSRVGFLSTSNSWGSYCATDGSWRSDQSMYAPIFYDLDNSAYYGDFASTSNINAMQMAGTLSMYGGAYYGTITFGTSSYWRCGISQRDAGNAEMRIWAKGGTSGSIYFATGFDGESGATTLPTDGMALKNNNLGLGSWGVSEFPSYKLHIKGTGYATNDFRAPIFYDSDNTAYYCDPAGTSNLVAITTGATGVYNTFNSWTNLNGYHGFYSGYANGSHFYVNNGSYGSWRIAGSRNGWGGLEFDRTHQICLMINHNEVGFYNTSYGWMLEWYQGTLYTSTGTYGGSLATVLHSSNYNSYSPTLTGGGASGTWSINITGNAGSASSVAWSNVSSKPDQWLNTTNLVDDYAPSATARPSGFYQSYLGSGNPTGTWFNFINVRHSNPSNGHGYQLGMSYYDNNLWFRSYQGGTSPTFQAWSRALGTDTDPYPSNMNQYVRTSDAPTFNGVYTNDWFRANGCTGLYFQSYGYGLRAAGCSASYGNAVTYGNGPNGYNGWMVYDPGGWIQGYMWSSGGNGGSYGQTRGDWHWYWSQGNGCMGIGGSTTTNGYILRTNGSLYVSGIIYATNYIQTASTLYASGDVIAYYSDGRLKDNVKEIDGAVDKLMKISGYTYTANDLALELKAATDKKQRLGVIAQEVKKVFPEVIEQAPFDRDALTGESLSGEDYMTVKYERLVPVLIQAIKEQQKQIDDLKALLDGTSN